ncbi:MAG: hypothetical protein Q4C61_10125 [Lachnospiraceae bacterium]|nr:hypothetical protein [Lachnospiraceae bacterium]
MEMKYFRFLFGEIGQCFVHLGELKDTRTGKHFTFLYLRKAERHVDQMKGTEHRLFLCPEKIDLFVLGQSGISEDRELEEFLRKTAIKTLVLPQESRGDFCLPVKAEEIIKIGASKEKAYRMEGAGWCFCAARCSESSLMMLYGPGRKEEFEDCVMSVKAADSSRRCFRESCPDEYGCALGCRLHQDYDECKYQRRERTASGKTVNFGATALLLPAVPDSEAWALIEEFQKELGGFRFLGIPDMKEHMEQLERRLCTSEAGYRQYFIGMGTELSDSTIAEVNRGGLQRRMAVLRPGEGLCCSGFLKYAANEG